MENSGRFSKDIALLQITSVKVGLWDSTYDVFQEMQQQHKQKAAVKTVSMAGPITVDCGPSLPTGPKATEGSSKCNVFTLFMTFISGVCRFSFIEIHQTAACRSNLSQPAWFFLEPCSNMKNFYICYILCLHSTYLLLRMAGHHDK